MADEIVDYFELLGIDPSATDKEVREAYKKAALKYHPDRVPADSPERAERTKKFQQVNDAYYTLSDKNRRGAYTTAHSTKYFKGAYATPPQSDEYSAEQFGSMFEEMLRENGMMGGGRGGVGANTKVEGEKFDLRANGRWFWSIMGAIGGAILGFIIANFTGMVAGTVAGNRIGAIRDREGKSVYAVYQELPASDRTRLLGQLAARMLQSTVS
ncbi:hypothetical protein MauCBS54593_003624 [Microsporum audouinii]